MPRLSPSCLCLKIFDYCTCLIELFTILATRNTNDMRGKMTPDRKARIIFGEIRSGLPRPNPSLEWTNEGMKEINLTTARTAMLVVDTLLTELYWWQFKRKVFYMAVKMELLAIRWAIINGSSIDI